MKMSVRVRGKKSARDNKSGSDSEDKLRKGRE